MSARALWKAAVRCDQFELPVKLYAAVEDRSIHFQLLHDQDLVRVKQRMVHPDSGDTVPASAARKGYEIERNVFVLFDDDELQALEPAPSRDIQILGFVPSDHIDPQWFDRPYWLGPDGNSEDYFALVTALADRSVQAIARWSLRKKQYVGALRVEQDYLALVTLRHAEEIISADSLEPPAGRALDPKERQLAGQLINALKAEFVASEYRDEYRDRVRQLIKAKQKGETFQVEPYEEPPATESLAESLEASLKSVGSSS